MYGPFSPTVGTCVLEWPRVMHTSKVVDWEQKRRGGGDEL